MRPFCANPLCLANKQEVPDDQVHLEGSLGNGLDFKLTRCLAVNEKTHVKVPFCDACAHTFAIANGSAKPERVGRDGVGAFCSNPKCFAHQIEVPDDQPWIELSLGGSNARRMTREYLVDAGGREEPFCSACANVFNIILGEPEYPDPEEGFVTDLHAVGTH